MDFASCVVQQLAKEIDVALHFAHSHGYRQ